MSRVVADNLHAIHAARENFIKQESGERIKRALRHNVRQSAAEEVRCGDMVFYKRNDCHKWQGPATVIGIDDRQVIVKNGESCARVHIFKLRHHNGEGFSDMSSGLKDGTTDGLNTDGDDAGLNVPSIEMVDVLGDGEKVRDEPPVAASLVPRIGMRIGGVRNSAGEFFLLVRLLVTLAKQLENITIVIM